MTTWRVTTIDVDPNLPTFDHESVNLDPSKTRIHCTGCHSEECEHVRERNAALDAARRRPTDNASVDFTGGKPYILPITPNEDG